jgi:hypothetical protein
MRNVAIKADFLSADFTVRLPAPNGDPKGWRYWVTIGADGGAWIAKVRQQITGMASPEAVGDFPISEISDATALTVAELVASRTQAPPVARRGRQHPPKSELDRSVWVVTLDGVDGRREPRCADVIITRGPMQEGLNLRPEPCTASVRRRTDFEEAIWYRVPCADMTPQNAGDAAVSACRWIRWD